MLVVFDGVEFLALGQTGLKRGADEVGNRHAGDFHRVLEGDKKPRAGALVGLLHFKKIQAIERDRAAGDLIVGVAGHDFGEGGFAGTVLAHDRVDLALGNFEVEAFEDLAVADVGGEVFDFEAHGVLF